MGTVQIVDRIDPLVSAAVLPGADHHVRLYRSGKSGHFRKQTVRVLCQDPQLSCGEGNGCLRDFRHGCNLAFDLGCAVGAVQIFQNVYGPLSLGGSLFVSWTDHHIRLNGFRQLHHFGKQGFRVFCCDPQLPEGENNGCFRHFGHGGNLTLDFCRTVSTFQILNEENFFMDRGRSLMMMVMAAAARLSIFMVMMLVAARISIFVMMMLVAARLSVFVMVMVLVAARLSILMMVVLVAACFSIFMMVMMLVAARLSIFMVMMLLPGQDLHIMFYGPGCFQNLRQQPIRILSCDPKLLGRKSQDRFLYLGKLSYFFFDLGCTMGAVQVFYEIHFFHTAMHLLYSIYEQLFIC